MCDHPQIKYQDKILQWIYRCTAVSRPNPNSNSYIIHYFNKVRYAREHRVLGRNYIAVLVNQTQLSEKFQSEYNNFFMRYVQHIMKN